MKRRERYQRLFKLAEGETPALALAYGRRYVEDYPDDVPALLLLGSILGDFARYKEAEIMLMRAHEHCPKEKLPLIYSSIGNLFENASNFDRAADWYQKAVDTEPYDATWRIFLGAVRVKQGHFDEAERVYRSALSCTDGHIDEAYHNLGLVLRAQERFTEAADCFREAISRDGAYQGARRALRDVERCIKLEESRAMRQRTLLS